MSMHFRSAALAGALCLSAVGSVFADVSLPEAVEIAVQGRWADEKTQSITLNGHGFYIRPVTVMRTVDAVTTEGFFRHRHRGKDDRIHYSIVASRGQPYKAVITKIEYRGVLSNRVVELGVEVDGRAKEFLDVLKKLKLQRLLDGNWEPQAAKIVDAIGARLNAEVN